MDYQNLGVLVRNLRKEKGWNQETFAGYIGISRPTLSAFENGRGVELGLKKFLTMVDLLGYSLKVVEKHERPTLEDLLDERSD